MSTSTYVSAAPLREATRALAERRGAPGDRPRLRPDLVARRVVQAGEVTWVLKNPEAIKYYFFSDGEWSLFQLFDGTRTREEIRQAYEEFLGGTPVELRLILEWEESLRKVELLDQTVAEKGLRLLTRFRDERRRRADEKTEGFNPFLITFHVFDPNRFLDATVRYVRWIWTPPVVAIWALLSILTIAVFAMHIGPIWDGTIELYAFLGKPLLDVLHFFFILSFIGLVHELGHAYAVKIYGGQVHDIGMALLYFTPAFYCDTTDALLFPSKWQKLWVTTAGIYIEGFVCAFATFLWIASYPDSLLHELAYKTMLFTGVSTIFFNVNPLIKIDGYYALASLVEIPELREDSISYLGALFKRHVLGLPVEVPVVSRRKQRIFWIYGVLALLYIGFLMAFIGGLFSNLYNKYVPELATVLVAATVGFIFKKRVRLTIQTAKHVYLDKKDLLRSRRLRGPLLGALVLLLLVLFVPWTHRRISVEGVLWPAHTVRLEAPEEAVVAHVDARESVRVAKGAPLFQLVSPWAARDAAASVGRGERFLRAGAQAREQGEAESAADFASRESSAHVREQSDRGRNARLQIVSPIAGKILTPRPEDFQGRYVKAGTLLAEVGDDRTLVAELQVSERRLDDLAVGARVSALAGERPAAALVGKVMSIAPAAVGGGDLSVGMEGRTAPSAIPERYIVLAQFPNADGSLRPGSRVRAKIYGARTSPAGAAWRMLRRWAQTVVW